MPNEPSGGSLPPNEDLEQAMREAEAAVEAAEHAADAEQPAEDETGASAEQPAEVEPGASAEPEVEPEVEKAEEAADPVQLQEANAALNDRLLRLAADFENFRRRTLRERQDSFRYGHENLVKDVLPTVDNLERAIDHALKSEGGDLEGFLQGVVLVLRDIKGALSKHGVVEVEAESQPFDPTVHEAMAQIPNDSVPPNTVVEVLERGYQLHDRLLRPARVVVSRGVGEAEGEAPEPGEDEGASQAE